MNTLCALTMESRRDLGIMKYLGAPARLLRRMTLVQAGILGLTGSLSGYLLGFILSLVLIYVINRQSFGWTIQFSLPILFLGESFALVMITSILSGVLPAK